MPPDLTAGTGVHDLVVEGARVRFDVDSAELDRVIRVLVDGGVRSLTATPPTLEELFLRHYGEHVEADAGDAARRTPTCGRHQKVASTMTATLAVSRARTTRRATRDRLTGTGT